MTIGEHVTKILTEYTGHTNFVIKAIENDPMNMGVAFVVFTDIATFWMNLDEGVHSVEEFS